MDLLIVRHALPERTDGDRATADPPLSDVGRRQAEATCEFLAGERIDHVVASPLRRAQATGAPLVAKLGMDMEVVEGLREIDPFGGAYVPAEEMDADHPVVKDFVEDRYSLFRGEGGFQTFRATVVAAFDGIVARNRSRRVAVFCHGTVIASYLTSVLGTDDPFVMLPDYCGITRIIASSAGARTLRSLNETAHVRGIGA